MSRLQRHPWWVAPIAVLILTFGGELAAGIVTSGPVPRVSRWVYSLACLVAFIWLTARSFRSTRLVPAFLRGFLMGLCFTLGAIGGSILASVAIVGAVLPDAKIMPSAVPVLLVVGAAGAASTIAGIILSAFVRLGRSQGR